MWPHRGDLIGLESSTSLFYILYKKKYPVLWSVFRAWKSLLIKEIVRATVMDTALKAFTKRIEESKVKRNKRLLKRIIDRWKLIEQTPKANIIYASVFCSF